MKHEQHTFHSGTIEVVIVLLASIISFPLSDIIGVKLSTLPIVIVTCYVALKTMYYLCISLSTHVINLISNLYQSATMTKQQHKDECTLEGVSSATGDNEILKKRIELFHYEFQHEQQLYRQQKEKADDEKLNAIMQYTRNTFKRFDLDETEIYQICESVRYFVTNRQVLTETEIHIKKHSSLTQISLKNFAWNIAFQYNIGGDMTTSFVMVTFAEWFSNSTFDTVRKNLRTTTGCHKIEIDENILSRYGI